MPLIVLWLEMFKYFPVDVDHMLFSVDLCVFALESIIIKQHGLFLLIFLYI